MFELLFVISLPDFKTVKEYFPESYATVQVCQDEGWLKADRLKHEIVAKYPDLKGFDIECRLKEAKI